MAPRCTTCGEYIYKGQKFSARKETVQNETYLGLLRFRFYIRCHRCVSDNIQGCRQSTIPEETKDIKQR
ncbi:Coiled-coil domain-containing protein 94 [Porites harrisoni]